MLIESQNTLAHLMQRLSDRRQISRPAETITRPGDPILDALCYILEEENKTLREKYPDIFEKADAIKASRQEIECPICGTTFVERPTVAQGSPKQYCTLKCQRQGTYLKKKAQKTSK